MSVQGYEIQRAIGAGEWVEEFQIIEDSEVLTWDDTDITNGTTYHYRIREIDGEFTSNWSNTVTIEFILPEYKEGTDLLALSIDEISSTIVSVIESSDYVTVAITEQEHIITEEQKETGDTAHISIDEVSKYTTLRALMSEDIAILQVLERRSLEKHSLVPHTLITLGGSTLSNSRL